MALYFPKIRKCTLFPDYWKIAEISLGKKECYLILWFFNKFGTIKCHYEVKNSTILPRDTVYSRLDNCRCTLTTLTHGKNKLTFCSNCERLNFSNLCSIFDPKWPLNVKKSNSILTKFLSIGSKSLKKQHYNIYTLLF